MYRRRRAVISPAISGKLRVTTIAELYRATLLGKPVVMTVVPGALARPLPAINEMNRYFWQGGVDGRLHIMQCGNCERYFHPYQATCSDCLSSDVAPQPVSGRGTVLSVTINHQPWFPHVPVPYVVALVELEERGPVRLVTNMADVPIDAVVPGMPVEVHFEQYGDVFVPLFRPA